jgi:glutathione S-transferase
MARGRLSEIVFYQIPVSHFCEKVRWALDFKSLAYRSVPVNPFTRRELAAVGESRQVPVIKHGEKVVADSSEIVRYLDEVCPDPPLVPMTEPERSECLEIERIADEHLGPMVRRVAYEWVFRDRRQFARLMLPHRWPARLANPLRRLAIPPMVRRHFGMTRARLAADRTELPVLLRDLTARRRGRRHYVGDTLTIADITVASLLGPLELARDLATSSDHAEIFSWMRALRAEHGRRDWT